MMQTAAQPWLGWRTRGADKGTDRVHLDLPPLPARSAAVRLRNLPLLVGRLCPLPAHTPSRLHSFGGNRGGNSDGRTR
jgi:hypothetical protein